MVDFWAFTLVLALAAAAWAATRWETTWRYRHLKKLDGATGDHSAQPATAGGETGGLWHDWRGKLLMLAAVGVILCGGIQWPPGQISVTDIALGLTWLYLGAKLST